MAKNKKMENFSKKTIGKSVDTVADYVDIVSQMIVEYMNQRYKIEQKVGDIKKATLRSLYALKTNFIKSIVEALFLTTGLLALVVGIIILLTRVIALEYILIGYGFIVSLVVLMKMKVKL